MRNNHECKASYVYSFVSTIFRVIRRYLYLMPFTGFWLVVLAHMYTGISVMSVVQSDFILGMALGLNFVVVLADTAISEGSTAGHSQNHGAGNTAGASFSDGKMAS